MDCDGEDSPEDIPILLKCFIKNKIKLLLQKGLVGLNLKFYIIFINLFLKYLRLSQLILEIL